MLVSNSATIAHRRHADDEIAVSYPDNPVGRYWTIDQLLELTLRRHQGGGIMRTPAQQTCRTTPMTLIGAKALDICAGQSG